MKITNNENYNVTIEFIDKDKITIFSIEEMEDLVNLLYWTLRDQKIKFKIETKEK